MNRIARTWSMALDSSVPHRRGDEPVLINVKRSRRDVFPTGVGMNRVRRESCEVPAVFPTGVGMNRYGALVSHSGTGVPHRRGDEPLAWQHQVAQDVFPTGVGMNRQIISM